MQGRCAGPAPGVASCTLLMLRLTSEREDLAIGSEIEGESRVQGLEDESRSKGSEIGSYFRATD